MGFKISNFIKVLIKIGSFMRVSTVLMRYWTIFATMTAELDLALPSFERINLFRMTEILQTVFNCPSPVPKKSFFSRQFLSR